MGGVRDCRFVDTAMIHMGSWKRHVIDYGGSSDGRPIIVPISEIDGVRGSGSEAVRATARVPNAPSP